MQKIFGVLKILYTISLKGIIYYDCGEELGSSFTSSQNVKLK
jgi:hypothetical protein